MAKLRITLTEKARRALDEFGQKKPKEFVAVKKPEKLSDKDLRELMGVDKPTYKKVKGGAWRCR